MIGIIIVGYNNKKYLPDCLGSVFSSSYKNYKVYFVDNNSVDDSIDYLNKEFPKVEIIANNQNLGFAKANNVGFKRAKKDKMDYVFFLNPDTLIDNDCLEILVRSADKQTILQPLILIHENGQKTNTINTSGNILHYLGISYCGEYKKVADNNTKIKEIAVASGAGFFCPIEAVSKAGGFDEDLFMYHEDVDLSWRLHLLGYNIKLLPEAKMWHKYSFGRNNKKMYYVERNRLTFLSKCFSLKYLILTFPMMIIHELATYYLSIKEGWFIKKIHANFSFWAMYGSIRHKRMRLLKNSTKNEADLIKLLSGDLDFSEAQVPHLYNRILDSYWKIISQQI